MYDTFLRDVETYFEEVRLLKRGARGSVTLLRHRSTGKRYIFRRFTGSAEVYRKLLTVDCPYLPRIEEVAERDGQVAVLEEYVQGDTLTFLLEGGVLSWPEARRVTEDVCAALWVLHSLGAGCVLRQRRAAVGAFLIRFRHVRHSASRSSCTE